jgi:flagellar basal body-associated protein FliL
MNVAAMIPKKLPVRLPILLLLGALGLGQIVVAVVFLKLFSGQGSATATPPAAVKAANLAEPAAEEHAEEVEAHDAGGHEASGHGGHGGHGGGPGGEAEVDLGIYSMTVPRKGAKTLMVSFHLYGTIKTEKQADFTQRYEGHQQRMRQEVLMLLRQSDENQLTDPELFELKKRLLMKINRLLGKAAVSDIIFSDFAILDH